ncbi:MAG: EAL domain-containing protein [Gammaproteobacteria bacterium]|nr:EAL domain-containing protein [Gammaproteobacteria bacterium]
MTPEKKNWITGSGAVARTEGLQLGKLYRVTTIILILAFLAYSINTWIVVQRQAEAELSYIDSLFRNVIESVFQHHESVLTILGQRVLEADARHYPERARPLIDELLHLNPSMAGFGLAEPNGQLVLVSGIPPGNPLPNLLAQSESATTFLQIFDTDRLVIGWTYYMPLLKKWLIPIRIAVQDSQGNIKLVSAAGLDIDASQAMWNAFDLPPDISVTLLRKDGFVQLSLPLTQQDREALYYEVTPGVLFSRVHEPLDLDPFNEDAVAVSSYLMGDTMKTYVSFPRSRLLSSFGSRLIMPGTLFVAVLLLTWFLFRRLLRNQRAHDAHLLHQANHDALTQLPNRLLVLDRLSKDLARARRTGGLVAVLYTDLDQFKRVNDSYGHKTGDILLKSCASRISGILRDCDTVGRLGGDEFLLILPDLHSVKEAESLASRILLGFMEPFQLEGREIFSTVSIGISVSPQDGNDPDTMIQNADTALYKAKDEGRNRYHFFRQKLNQEVARRMEVERALRKALNCNEFGVVYQPQVCLRTLRWRSVEALIRWNSPTLGFVSPLEFIPIAEDIGLIAQIGEYVLESALRDLKLIHQIDPAFCISVNASTHQFRSSAFVKNTLKLMKELDIHPEQLELEVTESVLADGAEQFHGLREAGIKLAVDDFGTGFSSLSYLKKIPITTLKIDRAFVKDLENDLSDTALTTAIIALAKALGLQTIAEGIETDYQHSFLKKQGCCMAQGYLFAKPMPVGELLDKLRLEINESLVVSGQLALNLPKFPIHN